MAERVVLGEAVGGFDNVLCSVDRASTEGLWGITSTVCLSLPK